MAILAFPMTRGLVPYSLVNRIRTRPPPALTRTTCRIVTLLNERVAGKGPIAGVGGSGAAPQVPTQVVARQADELTSSSATYVAIVDCLAAISNLTSGPPPGLGVRGRSSRKAVYNCQRYLGPVTLLSVRSAAPSAPVAWDVLTFWNTARTALTKWTQ